MAGAVLWYVRCEPKGIVSLELALVGASPHGGLLGPLIYLYSPPHVMHVCGARKQSVLPAGAFSASGHDLLSDRQVRCRHGPLTVEDAQEQQAILGTLAKEAHNEVHDLLTPQKRKRSGSDEDIDGETADSAEVRDAELEAAIYDGLMYARLEGDAAAADHMFGASGMDGDGDE